MTRRWQITPSLVLILASCMAFVDCGGGSSTGPPPPPASTITSVTASCFNTILQSGQTDQCTATVQGTSSFSSAVNWSASAGVISNTGLFTAPNSAGQVTITATSVQDATKSGGTPITIGLAQKSGFTYGGISHVSFSQGEYSSAAGMTSQDALATTGATWAGVLVTQYQANATATSIAASGSTPTDADLVAAITELHAKGLKVMLKPHVDGLDGSWRGTFQPSNVSAWFTSFTTFITHYATLAKNNNVEMLCFGTEYVQLSGSANLANWTSVITAIRGTGYTGKLAYAANATSATDEFTKVSFWSQVDVIGLDGYFPLTNHNDPTLAQLVAAWSNNMNGENIVADVTNFAGAHPGQPVIFTEIGYRSVAGTNTKPYDFSFTGAVDPIEQQNCYEAMYEVWSQQPVVMQGNFWWAWSVPAPTSSDTGYSPWDKPAQTILQAWQ